MKIHSARVRHARQIREILLDLSAPLTIVGGPNGAGKTTVQQAILAAMFACKKEVRDGLASCFDPESFPEVILKLSRGGPEPTIELMRPLNDDRGEWREGAILVKKKGEALKKVQETLPISAETAALILWGRQDDMDTVVDCFPADGHSLLTGAAIKGTGPDPKAVIKELEREYDNARRGERGGKDPGPLIQARDRVRQLEAEHDRARDAEKVLQDRKTRLEEARAQLNQLQSQCLDVRQQVERFTKLEKLLDRAFQDMEQWHRLEEMQQQRAELEEKISQHRKDLADLERTRADLQAQYRVARDIELGRQIENLGRRITQSAEAQNDLDVFVREQQAKKRPQDADLKKLENCKKKINQARDRMEASGVKYELTTTAEPRRLTVTEDGGDAQDIELAPGQVREGIVGRLVIVANGLRFSASGKEDTVAHKRAMAAGERELKNVLREFQAEDEETFYLLAQEGKTLAERLLQARAELNKHLAGATLDQLRGELALQEQARVANGMTLQDKEAMAGRHLFPAAQIDQLLAANRAELHTARETLAGLEEKRPSQSEQEIFTNQLHIARSNAAQSLAAFHDADPRRMAPSAALRNQFRHELESNRGELAKLETEQHNIEVRMSGLAAELRSTEVHRSLSAIAAELEEARAVLQREETLQKARDQLARRIQAKIDELTEHVPAELGCRVTQHLAHLSGGAFGLANLNRNFSLASVHEDGAARVPWQAKQLSFGQRHQAALAIKIAVARALAEASGPVFILLDDSLVSFDPLRRRAAEDLFLELVADGKLQIIILTCHTDWAEDWQRRQPAKMRYIYLPDAADYYRPPPGINISAGEKAARTSAP
jgi:DNA repair exonuclease SbcCD ATPase subunit